MRSGFILIFKAKISRPSWRTIGWRSRAYHCTTVLRHNISGRHRGHKNLCDKKKKKRRSCQEEKNTVVVRRSTTTVKYSKNMHETGLSLSCGRSPHMDFQRHMKNVYQMLEKKHFRNSRGCSPHHPCNTMTTPHCNPH